MCDYANIVLKQETSLPAVVVRFDGIVSICCTTLQNAARLQPVVVPRSPTEILYPGVAWVMARKREKQNTADANVNILCTNREQARFRCYFQLIEYLFCFTVSDGNLSSRAEITHGKLCDTVDCVTQIV